jgi:3-oxoacyl-[acyl-carrier protein] reductase
VDTQRNRPVRPGPERLAGQVVIVTGAAQGIGRGYAHRFAAESARVVVADRQSDKARAVATDLRVAGATALDVQVDVADRESVKAMVDRSLTEFGRIDVLVNNAGLSSGLQKTLDDITVDDWNRVLAVNVTGTFLCCQAVAPVMRSQRYGRIINIASAVVATNGPWRYAHYVTSKAGVVGLTRALATELGAHGITVNAISPGAVRTEVSDPEDDRMAQIIASQIIPRRQTVDDLVGVAVFLASTDARFVTGQVINVSGGMVFG